MENIQETLMSQYANSPIICNLIDGMNDCLDPSETIETFYELAFNVNTVKGFGLDIWGRIVGVNRNINMSSDVKTSGLETGDKVILSVQQLSFQRGRCRLRRISIDRQQVQDIDHDKSGIKHCLRDGAKY